MLLENAVDSSKDYNSQQNKNGVPVEINDNPNSKIQSILIFGQLKFNFPLIAKFIFFIAAIQSP